MKRLKVIYILLIIILLSLPLIVTTIDVKFNLKLDAGDNADIPKFDGSIFKFIKQYKKYFRSHYVGKNLFISVYNNSRFTLLQESPIPDRILVGKDDFLFYCNEPDGNLIVDYQGYIQLSQEELETIYVFLNSFYEWLKQRNIVFYFIVAPDKQTIYYDKLPDKIKKVGRTSTDQIIDYLIKKGIPVIDLRHPLLEAKALYNFDLYLKTDTHWNSLGSYIAYKSIINNLANNGFNITPINIDLHTINKKQLTERGDSYKMMKITKDPNYYDADLHYPRDYIIKYSEGDVPYARVMVTKTKRSNVKAVVYRDSFFLQLQPYLSNNFGYAYYVWEYLYKTKKIEKDKIEEIKPDIVIIETVERFLKYYKDIETFKNEENNGNKMKDDITGRNMN
mgnify:CR=1 FL=1